MRAEYPENEYLITCNYLEIYNEAIMDLLDHKHEKAGAQLSIREDLKKGVYVENLSEEQANSSEDAISLLIKGTLEYPFMFTRFLIWSYKYRMERRIGTTRN